VVAEIVRGAHVILHGNVHDLVVWDHSFVTLRAALSGVLASLRFDLIGRYDQVDGLSFAAPDCDQRFAALLRDGYRNDDGGSDDRPGRTAPWPASVGLRAGGRATAVRQRMAESVAQGAATPTRYHQPGDALAAIRRALAQRSVPVAFVIDFAELLLLDPVHHDRHDRDLLILVKKAMMEAEQGTSALARNQLLLISSTLAAVPTWLYADEPFVRAVEVPLPSFAERRGFLSADAERYWRPADEDDDGDAARSIRVLANLTEGMTLVELRGLRQTSLLERLPLTRPRELVNRAMFGQRADPWARLADRMPEAADRLNRRVAGQRVPVEGEVLGAGHVDVGQRAGGAAGGLVGVQQRGAGEQLLHAAEEVLLQPPRRPAADPGQESGGDAD
jgi:hypothetical protein